MTGPNTKLFWLKLFFDGGALALAVVCIFLATRKEARGPFKLLLWFVAFWLLVLEAVYWFVGGKDLRIP
jgi:hypothetical protein